MNIWVVIRILVGAVFAFAGFMKAIIPHQNVVYLIQQYELFPSALENQIGLILPWVELIAGIFLMLGLWIRPTLIGLWLLSSIFIVVVFQAILRHLPIDSCGCFGDWMVFKTQHILILDIVVWFLIRLMMHFPERIKEFSLDKKLA